jgi:hypothetical protein
LGLARSDELMSLRIPGPGMGVLPVSFGETLDPGSQAPDPILPIPFGETPDPAPTPDLGFYLYHSVKPRIWGPGVPGPGPRFTYTIRWEL